jgi:para-nitrobenzyl esterase
VGTIVETRSGKIEGTDEDGLQVFRGIPYAAPPVGERRFAAPEREEPWAGVRSAARFGKSAPQAKVNLPLPGMDMGETGEDCLTLNVWTPSADSARRPVLVWIHGGGFIIGSGSQSIYDGKHLAGRGDVVVVTINYRLGPLGYLDLTRICPDLPGAVANAGMRDQAAALQWVHENIDAFGGNPGDVTIFGESAGGMSVGTLLAMPSAKGLFRRAIPQSGASHNFHTHDTATRVAEAFLENLGLSPAEATRSLRELPAEALTQGQDQTMASLGGSLGLLPFQPTLDDDSLPESPLDAIRTGHAADVQLMTGCTRDEWKLFAFLDMKIFQVDEAGLVDRLAKTVPEVDAHGLVETYRRARADRGQSVEPPELFFAIETDRIFRIPATRLVEAQCGQQPSTYLYRFDWESPALNGVLGACHAIELPFVFGTHAGPGGEMFSGHGAEADALGARTMDAWLSFARNGSPGHDGLPAWPAYELESRPTLLLGPECRLELDVQAPERLFWEGVL